MRKIKLGISLDTPCGNGPHVFKGYHGLYLEESDRIAPIASVEQKLGIQSSEQRFQNVTREDLDTAANIFVYLIMCPGTLFDEQWFKSWNNFYNDLYLTQSPDGIILTRNRMQKSIIKNYDKNWGQKLFDHALNKFSLKYEEIQKILPPYRNLGEVKSLDLDDMLLSEYTNHPVHIINKNNKMSPSAFIPFCAFGGNMSAMGVKIDKFDVPVCKSFEARILNDQLCYEVDLNKFSHYDSFAEDLKKGLNFWMDYNADRQIAQQGKEMDKKREKNVVGQHLQRQNAFIYLNTIGRFGKV